MSLLAVKSVLRCDGLPHYADDSEVKSIPLKYGRNNGAAIGCRSEVLTAAHKAESKNCKDIARGGLSAVLG